jgi:uroporphyrinogen decarboxylase
LQGGEVNRFTYDEYRTLITPSDKYVLEHANQFSDNNMLHLCGWAGIKNRLECWQDYPAKAFNWAVYVEELGLKEGAEFFGGKTVLGGFDNTKEGLLYSGAKEDVETFTADLIKDSASTGLIIGADCSLSSDIDRQRISWVVEAAKTV